LAVKYTSTLLLFAYFASSGYKMIRELPFWDIIATNTLLDQTDDALMGAYALILSVF
jgi:hypothetical protein